MVRTELTADDSLAAIFERSKFGMAMDAMIRMIATTIRSSMSEKPFSGLFIVTLPNVNVPFGADKAKTLQVSGSTLWATSVLAGHASPTEFPGITWNHSKGGHLRRIEGRQVLRIVRDG